MKVITINEDNHGLIGIALNYYNAVKWLIENGWLDDTVEVLRKFANDDSYYWIPIKRVYGENYVNDILNNWDIKIFNEAFEGTFLLQSVNVIGTEDENNY